jgi:hypothetical protein
MPEIEGRQAQFAVPILGNPDPRIALAEVSLERIDSCPIFWVMPLGVVDLALGLIHVATLAFGGKGIRTDFFATGESSTIC